MAAFARVADRLVSDPRTPEQPFIKRDLSRFSMSERPFRENAIGNSFWESGCPRRLSVRSAWRLSRYGFLYEKMPLNDPPLDRTIGFVKGGRGARGRAYCVELAFCLAL